MKTKISLPVVISLIMSFIILSTSFTGVMAVNKTSTATVMSYSGATSGSGIFVGTNQNSEAGNENGAPCITGVTVSQTGGKIYSNRIGYVEFTIDRPTSEITNAKLMLYITSVNENLSGWMKLACYRTTGAPQNAVLGKDSSAAGYPAVNNVIHTLPAYWSDEIHPSTANSWKEINITKAVEDACSEQTDSDKITLKFRLQVPQAGVNISTQSPYLPKIVISDGTPEEDKNEYTRTGLFTHNMLSDNPGEVGYTSRYEHGDFMTERGYDGMTFSLFEAAQYGLLWDQYDKDRGIALTEEDYLKNPNDSSVSQMNAKKVFPYGSKERKWVEEKRAEIIKMYSDAKKNGQKNLLHAGCYSSADEPEKQQIRYSVKRKNRYT